MVGVIYVFIGTAYANLRRNISICILICVPEDDRSTTHIDQLCCQHPVNCASLSPLHNNIKSLLFMLTCRFHSGQQTINNDQPTGVENCFSLLDLFVFTYKCPFISSASFCTFPVDYWGADSRGCSCCGQTYGRRPRRKAWAAETGAKDKSFVLLLRPFDLHLFYLI